MKSLNSTDFLLLTQLNCHELAVFSRMLVKCGFFMLHRRPIRHHHYHIKSAQARNNWFHKKFHKFQLQSNSNFPDSHKIQISHNKSIFGLFQIIILFVKFLLPCVTTIKKLVNSVVKIVKIPQQEKKQKKKKEKNFLNELSQHH